MKLLVIGAGGHAKVVMDAALGAGMRIAGVVADSTDTAELMGYPVSRSAEDLDADAFIIAIGDNDARAQAFESYVAKGLEPAIIVHPSAMIAPSVTLGAGTFVAAGAVVNIDASVGRNVILNTGCTVDHDCHIEDHAHIAPGVNLCGGCAVGQGALIGVGASLIPQISVGAWSVVGAGAAVIDHMPPNSSCAGVPARVFRTDGV